MAGKTLDQMINDVFEIAAIFGLLGLLIPVFSTIVVWWPK